jgi:putative transposase
MRFTPSIFTSLLKPIDRRMFKAIVEKHNGDAYGKSFNSWEHLVTLLFAQVSGAASLRSIETGFNAQANQHYHLGCGGGPVARSTLGDANARRPAAIFAELFAKLAAGLGRKTRQEGAHILRLIDSTPVPLGAYFDCAASNGRIRGLKLHVLHDPHANAPLGAQITPANVNDIAFGRALAITPGVTYVFDKGYCHFGWWAQIAAAGAFFVTRPKVNMRWKTLRKRPLARDRAQAQKDGFAVRGDREVRLASKGDSTLPCFVRRITIKRENGEIFDVITNDKTRSAREIAACYKARWQIELFFKWLKQNLNIKKFIAMNENAIRLQILSAMIAFTLLRIASQMTKTKLTFRRFAELAGAFIHTRRHIAAIEKPPPINPSKAQSRFNPAQTEMCYA